MEATTDNAISSGSGNHPGFHPHHGGLENDESLGSHTACRGYQLGRHFASPPVASATPDEGDPQSSDCQATNSGLGGAETVCDTEGNAQITAVPPELGNGTGYGESACEGGCED